MKTLWYMFLSLFLFFLNVNVSVNYDFHSKYGVHLKTALKVENTYSLLFGDTRFLSHSRR